MSAFIALFRLSNNFRIAFFLLFAFSISARFYFALTGASIYYGVPNYTFGDSFSYSESFINLVNYGHFSFDLGRPDASLYRGPAYPFFWGMHYIVFGPENVYKAVAFSQAFLDFITCILIFLIIHKLTGSTFGAVVGFATYSFFPIYLIYIPLTGAETFATCITAATIYLALKVETIRGYILVGIFCAICVLTRQFLGLILPLVLLLNVPKKIERKRIFYHSTAIIFGFAIMVSPWFFRNWINHGYPTILMGETTGYAAYGADYSAMQQFYTLFAVDVTPIFESIATTGQDGLPPNLLPEEIRPHARELAHLAQKCAPSILAWRHRLGLPTISSQSDCSSTIIIKYKELRAGVIKSEGAPLQFSIPIKNLIKAIFKSELTTTTATYKDFLYNGIFGMRSLIIVVGITGVVFFGSMQAKLLLFFPISLVIYLSFIQRQVEMRYLNQADMVIFILFGITVGMMASFRMNNDRSY